MLSLSHTAHRLPRKRVLVLAGSYLLLPLPPESSLPTSLWGVEKISSAAAPDRPPHIPTLLTQGGSLER